MPGRWGTLTRRNRSSNRSPYRTASSARAATLGNWLHVRNLEAANARLRRRTKARIGGLGTVALGVWRGALGYSRLYRSPCAPGVALRDRISDPVTGHGAQISGVLRGVKPHKLGPELQVSYIRTGLKL